MSTHALVLRPQPGASATVARLTALDVPTRCCPLFVASPVAWRVPDPLDYDALLLTSANAVRHAGPGLRVLAGLPVLAVGEATAMAARDAGLDVALTGHGGAVELAAAAGGGGFARLLHLAGRDRVSLPDVDQLAVYASEPSDLDDRVVRGWAGQVALFHSARAARRFAELIDRFGVDRGGIDVAAISSAVAEAAGPGWRSCTAVARPDDALLAMSARQLIDRSAPPLDKRA